jgi:hypothetical protein
MEHSRALCASRRPPQTSTRDLCLVMKRLFILLGATEQVCKHPEYPLRKGQRSTTEDRIQVAGTSVTHSMLSQHLQQLGLMD